MLNLNKNLTGTNSCDLIGDGPPVYNIVERGALLVLFIVIICLTMAGNIVVITSIITNKQLHSFTNYFVISLALSDTLVAIIVMPFGTYNMWTNHIWDLGHIMCKVATCFDVMLTTTSILHLSCVAMDRYIAICRPFYHERVTKKAVLIFVASCWSVPLLISWMPIMNEWNTIGIKDTIACKTSPDGRTCTFLVNIPFALICSSIAFYIPTIFMFAVNTKIYIEAKKQAMQIHSLEAAVRRNKSIKSIKHETRAFKTLSIIMGCYCVCWCPFFILNVIDPFIGYRLPYYAWAVALWLGYVNSTLNPFLYYSFNRHFRKAIQKTLSCCKCSCH